MNKHSYTPDEVDQMLIQARYDELKKYFLIYDRSGLKGQERLDYLKSKIDERG